MSWVVECNLYLNMSINSIRFAAAALLLQERGPPLTTSWTQFLWKQESEAFSQVKWMMVDSANLFPTPRFIFLLSIHLHVRNKFSPYNIIFWWKLPDLDGRKEGVEQKPTLLQHFNQQPHFLLTVKVNFLWIMDDNLMNMHTAYYACEVWWIIYELKCSSPCYCTKIMEKKKPIFTLWAGRVICQSDSSPAIISHHC